MSELKAGFESLPEEYRAVLQLAQEQHQITVAPLQTLVGGWSGAMVFLVSVAWVDTKRVEHCILKLDRKSKTARSDEVTGQVTGAVARCLKMLILQECFAEALLRLTNFSKSQIQS